MDTYRVRWVKTVILATLGAAAIIFAAPANADVDSDFANELHSYGIYGPKDFNAWIGKIACKRFRTGLDADAYESAAFLKLNLNKDSTAQNIYDFMGASIRTYCPDQQFKLDSLVGQSAPAPVPSGEALPAEQG
jgi:hypothetical protein